jgi:alpha-N-arabinofuranosidase
MYTEYAKVMKWTDPSIKLIASGTATWGGDYIERARLLMEQAGNNIDYMAVHWYVGNPTNDFDAYMALSELFEQRLCTYEGIIQAGSQNRRVKEPIAIAVDEWNVLYRSGIAHELDEVYNLEDALMTAIQMNSFIRHARSVRMATIAQIVNVIAPIVTLPDGLLLQSIFYPLELYSRNCGDVALDVRRTGDTFSGGKYGAVRVLDVAASLDTAGKRVVFFVVNRTQDRETDVEIKLMAGDFAGPAHAFVVNGPDIKAFNTVDAPNQVLTHECSFPAGRSSLRYTFEPHSVTTLVCGVS